MSLFFFELSFIQKITNPEFNNQKRSSFILKSKNVYGQRESTDEPRSN